MSFDLQDSDTIEICGLEYDVGSAATTASSFAAEGSQPGLDYVFFFVNCN